MNTNQGYSVFVKQFFLFFFVFLIIEYKIIDKYINFNIILYKISKNINNNSQGCSVFLIKKPWFIWFF